MKVQRLSIYRLVLLSLLGALLFVSQVALSWLPNIEIVSILLITYTRVYGLKVLYPLYIFVMMEGLFYGFGQWFLNYLYVWLPLVLVAWAFRRMSSPLGWAIISAIFGLMFGALCSILYLFMGGPSMMVAYWVGGVWFDLLHCGGNLLAALILTAPLYKLLNRLNTQLGHW